MRETHNRLAGKSSTVKSPKSAPSRFGLTAPVESAVPPRVEPPRYPSLGEALDHFQLRARFLEKIRLHLEKMRDLAAFNAENKVDEDRCQGYYHHACTVKQIAATCYNGAPLFDRGNIVADAGDHENHLIMEGLDLTHPAIAAATESSIASKEQAAQARDTLHRALRYITVVESVLESNLSRLSFMNRHLELVA
jgi:hypothetical protein